MRVASRYPLEPFRIPDETPVCDRVRIMNEMADESVQYESVQKLAGMVRERAAALYKLFLQAAKSDKNIAHACVTQNCHQRMLALEALRAVQSLPYVPDRDGQEWFQSADYTLRHGGDCDDLVIALVALDRALGLRAEPYWITQHGQDINHVTSRVAIDGQWLWSEPSIRGAMLGESPYEAAQRTGSKNVGIAAAGLPADVQAGLSAQSAAMRTPFAWHGWNTIWNGWSSWWWCQYLPYLCVPHEYVLANPVQYGFYPLSAPYAPFQTIRLGAVYGYGQAA